MGGSQDGGRLDGRASPPSNITLNIRYPRRPTRVILCTRQHEYVVHKNMQEHWCDGSTI